jgi:hypothetical protein
LRYEFNYSRPLFYDECQDSWSNSMELNRTNLSCYQTSSDKEMHISRYLVGKANPLGMNLNLDFKSGFSKLIQHRGALN